MLGPELEVAQRTDPGRDPNKQENEDAAGYQPTRLGHLLVVCDGMGGHALGREASQLAVRTIVQMVEAANPGLSPAAALHGAIVQAGRFVYQMGGAGPQAGRPGSTCVSVLVHAGRAEVAHVGDSRAFLFRRGQIWQLTKDHSVVQQMIDLGALTADQAARHPEANKITRALGMKAETDVELREPAIAYEAGDIFVLATDGLCDLVRIEEIAAALAQAPSLEAATEELVRAANARGGHDNITVLLARVGRATGPRPSPDAGPVPTLVDPLVPIGPEKTVVAPAAQPAPAVPPPVAPLHLPAPVHVPVPVPAPVPVPVPPSAPVTVPAPLPPPLA